MSCVVIKLEKNKKKHFVVKSNKAFFIRSLELTEKFKLDA